MKYNIVYHYVDDNCELKNKIMESFNTQEEADKALLIWIRLGSWGWYTIEKM